MESVLIKTLEQNNTNLEDFLKIIDQYIVGSDLFKFSKFYLTFTSMVRQNAGKYLCPFNGWYFAFTDKQVNYLLSLKNKSYKGEYLPNNGLTLCIKGMKPINICVYNPNQKSKTYFGITTMSKLYI
jgi:hypothetical protein